MIDKEIYNLSKQTNLEITVGSKSVEINPKLRFSDILIFVLLFCLAVFLIVISVLNYLPNTALKIVVALIGLLLLVASTSTIIARAIDRLKITNTEITFRHGSKLVPMPLNKWMKIKMETTILKTANPQSGIILISHYLEDSGKKMLILTFQMDRLNEDNAKKLGNAITKMINDKIGQLNFK